MNALSAVFSEYDFLLPSKFEGGYLILALYEKIQQKELHEPFNTKDIKQVWEEISLQYHQPKPYGLEDIIHMLGHYLIRDEVGQYGNYRLTQHARDLVEMLADRVSNPFKEYPLKQTFDEYFYILRDEIKSFADLDVKFGKRFVGPRLRVITGHLDALQEELNAAYGKLGAIIQSASLSATEMVQQFVAEFRRFGDRAEDIRLAVASKDAFLVSLRSAVNGLYEKMAAEKQPESEEERRVAEALKSDWEQATEILSALTDFFQEVDAVIERVRQQILYASDRLSELQYNLDTRSEFLLRLKKMLKLTLEQTTCEQGVMQLPEWFPRKNIPGEKTRFFVPGYYDFALPVRNKLIIQTPAGEYYQRQAAQVKKTVAQEHRIRHWVHHYQGMLKEQSYIELNDAFSTILAQDGDMDIVLNVGYELIQLAWLDPSLSIDIAPTLSQVTEYPLYIWNTKISTKAPTAS